MEPMICEASAKGEIVTILGEEQPVLYVRAGVRRYWALKSSDSPKPGARLAAGGG